MPTQIAYDTTQLSGSAGKVTIDFTNPSAVTHDVCLTGSSGQQIGGSPTITRTAPSLSENLKPGKYTFFCSVDGHEAAGMKGTLLTAPTASATLTPDPETRSRVPVESPRRPST